MFTTLIEYWLAYEAAMKAQPYDPDLVQGLGMRFCDEWKRCKSVICFTFGIEDDDFEYSLHWSIMGKLNERTQVQTTKLSLPDM